MAEIRRRPQSKNKTAPIRIYLGVGEQTRRRHDQLKALALAFGFDDGKGNPNVSAFIQAIADGAFDMRLKQLR